MNQLLPIIRRVRRPLSVPDESPTVNPLALKLDRVPPVAVVPLVAAVPESVPIGPKRRKDGLQP